MRGWRFINGLAFLFWGSMGFAAPPADRSVVPSADRIVITSQSLVFKNQENMAVFDGKVVMAKVGFVMHADHMIVYFAGGPETVSTAPKGTPKTVPPGGRTAGPELPTLGNRAVSLIEAMGNVIMEQGGKTAKSKKAVYSQHDEKLVLTGDPQVWEEGYHVTGVKMTMFLKEDRSIVESSRVVINDADTGPR
jgi:lipopolysaccharide export system protein LptA